MLPTLSSRWARFGTVTTLAVAASLLAMGCGTVLIPRVTVEDAVRSGTSLEHLAEGRTIYVAKCTGCHAPLAPSALTADGWRHEMQEMSDVANLDDESARLVLAYLSAFSRDQVSGIASAGQSAPLAAPREATHP